MNLSLKTRVSLAIVIVVVAMGVVSTVVGVAPRAFEFPFGAQIWSPVEYNEQTPSRTAHNHRLFSPY